jgi:hypothetical protein
MTVLRSPVWKTINTYLKQIRRITKRKISPRPWRQIQGADTTYTLSKLRKQIKAFALEFLVTAVTFTILCGNWASFSWVSVRWIRSLFRLCFVVSFKSPSVDTRSVGSGTRLVAVEKINTHVSMRLSETELWFLSYSANYLITIATEEFYDYIITVFRLSITDNSLYVRKKIINI